MCQPNVQVSLIHFIQQVMLCSLAHLSACRDVQRLKVFRWGKCWWCFVIDHVSHAAQMSHIILSTLKQCKNNRKQRSTSTSPCGLWPYTCTVAHVRLHPGLMSVPVLPVAVVIFHFWPLEDWWLTLQSQDPQYWFNLITSGFCSKFFLPIFLCEGF